MLTGGLSSLDEACSRFRPDSELRKLERSSRGRPVAVSPLLFEVLEVACAVAVKTAGTVDPTVGSAIISLGYDRDFDQIEEPGWSGRRHRPRPAPGWWRVELDPRERTVVVPSGIRIDVGATAKAWAADRAARTIAFRLGGGALVNLGGDVAVAGPPPTGGWSVGIAEYCTTPGEAVDQVVAVHAGGLATSGTTARSWMHHGRRVHHIIDPWSGEPRPDRMVAGVDGRGELRGSQRLEHRRRGVGHRRRRGAHRTGDPGPAGGRPRRRHPGRRLATGPCRGRAVSMAPAPGRCGDAHLLLDDAVVRHPGHRHRGPDPVDGDRGVGHPHRRSGPVTAVAGLRPGRSAQVGVPAGPGVPGHPCPHLGARHLRPPRLGVDRGAVLLLVPAVLDRVGNGGRRPDAGRGHLERPPSTDQRPHLARLPLAGVRELAGGHGPRPGRGYRRHQAVDGRLGRGVHGGGDVVPGLADRREPPKQEAGCRGRLVAGRPGRPPFRQPEAGSTVPRSGVGPRPTGYWWRSGHEHRDHRTPNRLLPARPWCRPRPGRPPRRSTGPWRCRRTTAGSGGPRCWRPSAGPECRDGVGGGSPPPPSGSRSGPVARSAVLVVNAMEGEPASAKDRHLLDPRAPPGPRRRRGGGRGHRGVRGRGLRPRPRALAGRLDGTGHRRTHDPPACPTG